MAAAMLVVGAACSSDPDDRADTESVVDRDGTDGSGSGTATDGDGDGEDGEAAETAVEAPAEPLATAEGEAGMMETLEILDLRRLGDTVTVEFVVVTGDDIGRNGYDLLGPADSLTHGYAVSGVTLVDHDNRKRHVVLRDSNGECLCSRFRGAELSPGTRYRHSAQFAAPPDGVDTMTVEVPTFPAVDGVPLRTVG